MKILKGNKFKGQINHNTLYLITESNEIEFVEKQKDTEEEDYVDVKFNLKNGQYAIFASEFRPNFLANSKKVDIFLLVVDENERKCSSWICDVKVSVGGKDVIEHLVAQWIASYRHKCTLTNYLDEFSEKETIAVITRNYQADRIQEIIEKLQKEIETLSTTLNAMPKSSNIMNQQRNLLIMKKEYQMYNDFQRGIVSIEGEDYPITIYKLEGEKTPYRCKMEVSC